MLLKLGFPLFDRPIVVYDIVVCVWSLKTPGWKQLAVNNSIQSRMGMTSRLLVFSYLIQHSSSWAMQKEAPVTIIRAPLSRVMQQNSRGCVAGCRGRHTTQMIIIADGGSHARHHSYDQSIGSAMPKLLCATVMGKILFFKYFHNTY